MVALLKIEVSFRFRLTQQFIKLTHQLNQIFTNQFPDNMRIQEEDTPPSSINDDEITGMEDEGVIYLEEMEEIPFDDDMEDVDDQEEEDTEMEPPEDHSKLVFNKHIGSVFCCDLHPSGKLAVTGGEDDKAYVWSVESGQVVMDCVGHKDSVVFVGFSFDGAYVATADMCGVIKVWKCNLEANQQDPWPVAFEHEIDDLTWGQWHFGARVLICGTVHGDIYVLKIPSGDTKVLQGHNLRVECAKVTPVLIIIIFVFTTYWNTHISVYKYR